MSLPAEIRLSIYKLVLVRDDCVDFCQRRNFAHSSHFLRLNRVIHEEGAAVLYGSNKFIFAPSKAKVSRHVELWPKLTDCNAGRESVGGTMGMGWLSWYP